MIKIDGYLINGRPDQTRVYVYPEKQLCMTVLISYDQDYIRKCGHIKQAALYTLIWPETRGEKRSIYIGQTGDASQRILQHIQKHREFSDACVLTRSVGQFEKSEVMYLEYLAIIQAIEQGDVELMENRSIPEEPYLSPDKKVLMRDVFNDYMMMVEYAGFNGIYTKRKFALTQNIKRPQSKRISLSNHKLSAVHNDFEYQNDFDEEESIIEKHVLKGPDFYAECIKLNDGRYMLLGNTKIADDVNIDELSILIPNVTIDEKNRTVGIGTTVGSLDEAAILVTGGHKAVEWEIERTII